MKLQLSKTKTITIGGAHRALSDVTGVVLNGGDERGCPAVRLVHKKGGWSVAAAGFVPTPVDALPDSWDGANKAQTPWSLPAAFQAPHAALAVLSPSMFTRQTTPDALTQSVPLNVYSIPPSSTMAPTGATTVLPSASLNAPSAALHVAVTEPSFVNVNCSPG